MTSDLVEEGDYYLEDGNVVLTAAFLKKRGYCCESGCRHCPYNLFSFTKEKRLYSKKKA